MEEFTTADLIAELQEFHSQKRRPGGVTDEEFAEAEGKSIEWARQFLLGLVKKGVLIREKARFDGYNSRWVYYKAKPEAPS